MGRLAGYLRVSHVGGRTPDRLHSPDEQTEEISGWAAGRGHSIDFLEPELDGKGDNPDRPILRDAVEGIKAGRWDGVVVAYLSRAGRGLRLMLDLWDEIEDVGGTVYFARENIDGSTTSGKLQRNLLASIAQHELEERRDGFERACRGAVESGIWQRRQTPRGYSKDPETRRLVINDQADEVRDAARDLLAGERVVKLAERLRMTPGGIRAMLRNRVYLGELKVRSHVNPEAHPAVLDPETFAALEVHLRSAPRPGRNKAGTKALLAGLVRCSSCGHVMTRKTGRGDSFVYQCPTYHSGERCPRPAGITAKRVDDYVAKVALRELEKFRVSARSGDGIGIARRQLAAAEANLSGYLEAVDIAGVGSIEAAAGMRSRREKVDEARERLQAETARAPRLPTIERGGEIWESLSIPERNDLLRSLLSAVVVRPVGAGVRIDVAERVRVLRYGAELTLPAGRTGTAAGLIPIWPDADDIDVIGVSGSEDPL